jgi:hypothetical protein
MPGAGIFFQIILSRKRGPRRPGTVFRFIDILDQLDVTWDLYSMTTDMLLGCLPAEFDRFKFNPT